ncbi:MAG TPA: GAF domain-containing sensor histidine kinase [Chloroflexota bacterium]|nr:GAF domain-containing sensor histidine kinase [Chloroflexota bacterium]
MSKLVPSTMNPEQRLRLLGQLARRINEYPSLHELAWFLYAQLHDQLPIDAFYVTFTASSTHSPLLTMIDGREQPPAVTVPPPEPPNDEQGESSERPVLPWHRVEHLLQSRLICAIQAGSQVLGYIAVAAYTPAAFSEQDGRFLETVADQLAGTFERGAATQRDGMHGGDASAQITNPAVLGTLVTITGVLGAISAAMSDETNPEQLYAVILHQAATVIPYDQATITLFEEGYAVAGAAVGHTLPQLLLAPEHQRYWREYRTLRYSLGAQESDPRPPFAQAGVQDLLSLPLLVNGALAGRLTFAAAQDQRFSAYHAHLGTLLAERATQVVRMAHLQRAQEAAHAKVAQLDTLRQDFVATVSHELRTPLTGILGYMELLLNRWTSLDDVRRRSMLQRAQSSAVRLEHLVTDLLLFSNVEHQELKLQLAGYPMTALVEQAVEDMCTKYRGQVITLRPPAQRAIVRADAQRAIQVLANLLDNAIKYSAEGKPVIVRWITRGQEVHVSIRDHGPGINAEDLPRLFTRFGTLGHQPRPGQVGTGIGLYICKKLLDAMHGRIWVTSKPGRGSIFHFTLPSAQAGAGKAGH